MTLVMTGCLMKQVGPPSGAGPMRYRDKVFTNWSTTSNLQYGSAPDLSNQPVALMLDLYEPGGDTAQQRPAVVQAHAGGFVLGDKADQGYLVHPLVKRGFVVAAINYRLLAPPSCTLSRNFDLACWPAVEAAIHDAQAAVRWLRANAATYRIDPNRIAVEGFSAGGIVATGVGVMSDQPGDSGNPSYSSRVNGWMSISGGLPGGRYVNSADPPGYLFSGDADQTVPYKWSVDTANALSATGQAAVLYTESGVGHFFPPPDLVATQSANFYYLALNLRSAQQ